jgi:ABC-type phosphate transport system substrate-binding protein
MRSVHLYAAVSFIFMGYKEIWRPYDTSPGQRLPCKIKSKEIMLHFTAKKAGIIVSAAAATLAIFLPIATANATASHPDGSTLPEFDSVGSDTIYCVDKAIYSAYSEKAVAVPPLGGENLGCTTTSLTQKVKKEISGTKFTFSSTGTTNCATTANWSPTAADVLFPNGSGAGEECLANDNGRGNVAFSRSSGGKTSSTLDASEVDYWAFALDAVTWGDFNGATTAETGGVANDNYAPKSLTPAQIQDIYNCTYTNWMQVGGLNEPIVLDYEQSGSGTGAFFAKTVLGLGSGYPVSTEACPINFVEENDGQLINPSTGTPQATNEGVIFPYSYALYTAQTNGTETNVTNGYKMEAIQAVGQSKGYVPSSTSITEAAAADNATSSGDACTDGTDTGKSFCSARYVYHVTDQELATSFLSAYDSVLDFVGVPASGTAPSTGVCGNAFASTITTYGFKPLTKATTVEGSPTDPVPGTSYCRQF